MCANRISPSCGDGVEVVATELAMNRRTIELLMPVLTNIADGQRQKGQIVDRAIRTNMEELGYGE